VRGRRTYQCIDVVAGRLGHAARKRTARVETCGEFMRST
jgi:hypothetical protein